MDVAILGDTHIPSRATRIPESFRERVRDADHVIHTGDFDSKGALADLRDLAPELTAVHGNMDPQVGLPGVASVELGGVTFVVTHGTGSPSGWHDRVFKAVRQETPQGESGVGVAGHTHEVVDDTHGEIRLLNPGSATGAAPADRTTMLTADVEGGSLGVTVHEA
jgi:hypothetical protein